MTRKNIRKLKLTTETVRTLKQEELAKVAGGITGEGCGAYATRTCD
jgi:hypothetical protein